MKRVDPLSVKSTELAVVAIQYVRALRTNGLELSIANQLIRSSAAPGALIAEAKEAESKADTAHKFSIALKEARETEYWLEIVERTSQNRLEQHDIICGLLNEVISILVASIKTLRS